LRKLSEMEERIVVRIAKRKEDQRFLKEKFGDK
jgi:hypothetical protein